MSTSSNAAAQRMEVTSDVSLGQTIKGLRTARNLSLQRLAELSDVSVGMLSPC